MKEEQLVAIMSAATREFTINQEIRDFDKHPKRKLTIEKNLDDKN